MICFFALHVGIMNGTNKKKQTERQTLLLAMKMYLNYFKWVYPDEKDR